MKPKRTISSPVLVSFSLLTRLKILFGWRVFFVVETGFAIHEPRPVVASSRFAVVPPWAGKPEGLAGMLVPQGRV